MIKKIVMGWWMAIVSGTFPQPSFAADQPESLPAQNQTIAITGKANKEVASIQLLRALAAWMIVATHFFDGFYPGSRDSIVVLTTTYGYLGVELFFIISGFVMYLTTYNVTITPMEFMKHRVFRIAPEYWFFTFVTLASYTTVNWNFVFHSLAFIPDIYNKGTIWYPVLAQGWTLIHEMSFYTIFAITLILPVKFRLLGCFAGILAIQHCGIDFYASKISFDFILGIGIAMLYTKGFLKVSKAIALLGGVVSMMGLFVYLQTANWLFLSVLMICVISQETNCRLPKFVLMLANVSYSTYLCHLLIFNVAQDVLTDWVNNKLLFFCMTAVLIIIVSWIVNKLFSTLTKKLKEWFLTKSSSFVLET